jgi:hypothetical protein
MEGTEITRELWMVAVATREVEQGGLIVVVAAGCDLALKLSARDNEKDRLSASAAV